MSLVFLIFLSVLQGVTELFPVSSLGHTLLVPALFDMHIDKHAPQLLPFLVALHLGTAFALLWYFRRRWIAIIQGLLGSLGGRRTEDGHLAWALLIGTIPAGVVGVLLEKRIEHVFHDLRIVALALVINGILLWIGDRLQRARGACTRGSNVQAGRAGWHRANRCANSGFLAQRLDNDRRRGCWHVRGKVSGVRVPARYADYFWGGPARGA